MKIVRCDSIDEIKEHAQKTICRHNFTRLNNKLDFFTKKKYWKKFFFRFHVISQTNQYLIRKNSTGYTSHTFIFINFTNIKHRNQL